MISAAANVLLRALPLIFALGWSMLGWAQAGHCASSDINVIFIVIDATRGDHFSYAGYQRNTTPNLDALAEDSTVFLNAISSTSWTLPSYTAILSGEAPYRSRIVPGGGANVLTGTAAQTFNDGGFDTVSIQTNYFLRTLDSEFSEHYWFMSPTNNIANKDADSRAVDQAIAWLDVKDSVGNFMFMGLIGPHSTYYPHSEYFSKYYNDDLYRNSPAISVTNNMDPMFRLTRQDFDADARIASPPLGYYDDARVYQAAYDSELAYTDAQIGRLIDYLKDSGLFDSSLIVVTADHGEAMAEGRNFFTHGDNLRQSEINVPLLVKLPYQYADSVVTDYVSNLDIFPTIYDYLGWDGSGQDGVSLLSLIYGQDTRRDQGVVSSLATQGGMQYSYIVNGLKLIKYLRNDGTATYELYNLLVDPRENQDISAQYPDQVRIMNSSLTARLASD